MTDSKKLAFFLPNIFTALNMACGFLSIHYSFKEDFYFASISLLIGSIFDAVDGRIARLTGTQSSFGEQFDSISDVISFGVAPSLLIYHCSFNNLGKLGIALSFVFLLCGALRLARFNANIEKVSSKFFQGLPIPGAAIGVVGYVLLSTKIGILRETSFLAGIYIVFYAFLMISNIPFYSFKEFKWIKTRKKLVLFIIFLLMSLIFAYEDFMIFTLVTIYVFGCLVYFFILKKGKIDDVFHWESGAEKE